MVKISKELSLGVLLVLIIIMILKPNLLGFLYNNVLGKLVFVAAVVFLSLKHTAAGLLAVVFVAIVASMSGYHGFEGMDVPDPEATAACEGENCEADANANANADANKKKKDVHPTTEGAEGQAKPKPVADIEKLLKPA